MNREDRDEVRELLQDVLAGHHARLESQNDVMNLRLTNIQEDVTETKDRVKRLETEPHSIVNCIQTGRVNELTDFVKESKTIAKYNRKIAAVIAAVVSTLIGLAGLLIG